MRLKKSRKGVVAPECHAYKRHVPGDMHYSLVYKHPYVRHLEAISQAKRLWINTNQKAAKQTIGAKWTQLIPPASGRNKLSRKICR